MRPICESLPCLLHYSDSKLRLDDDEPLLFPKNQSLPLDEYLSTIPRVASRSKEVLESSSSQELSQATKCLNVLQGEIAHATASQADVVVSAQATTCHVVALRSTTSLCEPLVSLAHVDHVGYDRCLEGMVKKHIEHHHSRANKVSRSNGNENEEEYGFFMDDDVLSEEDDFLGEMIEIEVHMLGGFLDVQGTSQQLSTFLLLSFSKLASQYNDVVKMKIATAAISCMNNHHQTYAPVGRGLGIHTQTGQVFCVNSVPSNMAGPALELRSARAFRKTDTDRDVEAFLNVIHDTKADELVIEPFKYEAFKEMDILLQLPNETLLKYTSTSPECEADGFCDDLRNTLGFIKRVPSERVFGTMCDEPMVYQRSRSQHSLNEWKLRTS